MKTYNILNLGAGVQSTAIPPPLTRVRAEGRLSHHAPKPVVEPADPGESPCRAEIRTYWAAWRNIRRTPGQLRGPGGLIAESYRLRGLEVPQEVMDESIRKDGIS